MKYKLISKRSQKEVVLLQVDLILSDLMRYIILIILRYSYYNLTMCFTATTMICSLRINKIVIVNSHGVIKFGSKSRYFGESFMIRCDVVEWMPSNSKKLFYPSQRSHNGAGIGHFFKGHQKSIHLRLLDIKCARIYYTLVVERCKLHIY
jgi:hypothetical protein